MDEAPKGQRSFLQQIGHAPQADYQRGSVVEQGGGGGGQDAGHTETNEHEVKGDDKAIVVVNARHQGVTQFLKGQQTIQVVCPHRDIRQIGRASCRERV